MIMRRRVGVFCGASSGSGTRYLDAAEALGRALVARDLGLVFGGGRVGLMGAVADAVLAAGGEAIGVIPEALVQRELAHQGLTRLHIVGSMHERKALMADLADAFVALPGGYGTLDELAEVMTWAQLGIHAKPIGLLDVDDYFAPLLAFFDRAAADGFLRTEHRRLLSCADDAEALLGALGLDQAPRPGRGEGSAGASRRTPV